MDFDRFAFNRGAIRPLQCVAEGWGLVKSEYWFFVGVCFVGLLIAELGPLGLLLGPALCGIHICLLRHANGQKVTFDMLFQGFNYFGPGFVATLCMMGPILLLVAVYYALVLGGTFGIFAMVQPQGGGPPPERAVWMVFGWLGVATLGLMLFVFLLQMLFIFVFPLIVDRELTGWQAVRTSCSAVFANFGGVFAIVFLEMLFGLLGQLLFCVGFVLVIPVTFAMTAVAYRQVFPAYDPYAGYDDNDFDDGPPPAPRLVDDSTHVQSSDRPPAADSEPTRD